MLKKITLELDLFKSTPGHANFSRLAMLEGLEAMCRINERWLSYANYMNNKMFPSLYNTHVVYKPEKNTEIWRIIPIVFRDGFGDCEDLSCWRVAELRQIGIRAKSYIKWRKIGGNYRYHALVALPDGKIEDPSLALGMGNSPIIRKPVYVEP